jgi:aconitase B
MAELQEIRLVSEEAEEVLTWMTDEYRLQLYAPDLLKALESQIEATRGIIDAWENTDCLPEAVQDLIDALDRQSEYARAVLDAWENSDLVGAISGLEDSLAAALKAIADAKGGAA